MQRLLIVFMDTLDRTRHKHIAFIISSLTEKVCLGCSIIKCDLLQWAYFMLICNIATAEKSLLLEPVSWTDYLFLVLFSDSMYVTVIVYLGNYYSFWIIQIKLFIQMKYLLMYLTKCEQGESTVQSDPLSLVGRFCGVRQHPLNTPLKANVKCI